MERNGQLHKDGFFTSPFIIPVALSIIFIIHGASVRHFYFVCDDAYISFRYLMNWLDGNGLVYNIGERVEGYTNLLWIVLIAPFVKFGMAPEKIAPVLSILFSYALLTLVFFFPWIVKGKKPEAWWPMLLATFLLAINRSYGVWATGGLETRLFSFLILAGLVLIRIWGQSLRIKFAGRPSRAPRDAG